MLGKLIAPAVLIAAFLALAVPNLTENSITVEEAEILPAGYSSVQTGNFRLAAHHPPLIPALAAAPLSLLNLRPLWQVPGWNSRDSDTFFRNFLTRNRDPLEVLLFAGRVPTIGLGLLMGLILFVWAIELWGYWPAVAVLGCYSLSPSILGYTTLATTRIGLACFTLCAVYALWKFAQHGALVYAAGCGMALGLALLSEYAGWVSAACVAVLLAALGWSGGPVRLLLTAGLLILAITALLVTVGYGFPLGLVRYSAALQQATRATTGPTFLWGTYSTNGFWYYPLLELWWRTPIPILLLLAGFLLREVPATQPSRLNSLFIVVPIAAFLLAGLLLRPNTGLRLVLPALPFILLASGGSVRRAFSSSIHYRIAFAILGVWTIGATLRTAPHFLTYCNELAGGIQPAIRHLDSSDFELGQDLVRLRAYFARHRRNQARGAVFSPLPLQTYGLQLGALEPGELVRPRFGSTYILGARALQAAVSPPESQMRPSLPERFHLLETIGGSLYVYRLISSTGATGATD
jgi:hypothetical protein